MHKELYAYYISKATANGFWDPGSRETLNFNYHTDIHKLGFWCSDWYLIKVLMSVRTRAFGLHNKERQGVNLWNEGVSDPASSSSYTS